MTREPYTTTTKKPINSANIDEIIEIGNNVEQGVLKKLTKDYQQRQESAALARVPDYIRRNP